MKQFKTKVWLPDNTNSCGEGYDRCPFLLGRAYCVLLGKTLATEDDVPVKDSDCPAFSE